MPKGRKKQIDQVENVAGEEVVVSPTKIPGRPKDIADQKAVAKKSEEETKQEASLLFRNTKGQLCRKVFEVFKTPRGTHQRLIRVEKNVSIKESLK